MFTKDYHGIFMTKFIILLCYTQRIRDLRIEAQFKENRQWIDVTMTSQPSYLIVQYAVLPNTIYIYIYTVYTVYTVYTLYTHSILCRYSNKEL